MKKRLLFTLISTLLIFSASGCKRHINLKNQPPTSENTDKIGSYIKKIDLSFNDVTYKQMLEDTIEDVKGAKSVDEIYNIVYKTYVKTNELIEKYYVADALYSYNQNDEEIKKKRSILSDTYYEYETFRANITYELRDEKELLMELLGLTSIEDVNYEIELAEKKKEDKYKTLKKEIDDIYDEFSKMNVGLKTDSSKVAEITYRYVNKNKELSEFLGFDSYIQYKDIEYNRLYTLDDSKKFISNVKKYILPSLVNESDVIDISKLVDKLSYPEYSYLIELDETSVYDKDYKTLNLAKDYAKKMGGSYYKTFHSFINDGHFVFANNSGSLAGGYTNPYLSYFGPGYQNINTVVHEFGHYYSMNVGGALYKSLDLEEFYSQGNEFLFMSYLEKYSEDNVKNVYDVLSAYKINEACSTLVIGSALREYEEKIYSTELTSQLDVLNIWEDLNANGYNNNLKDFWKVEVRYDNYYLSYATSVTGALSLYSYSQTSFIKAKEAYISACQNTNFDDDIEEVLEKNHLSNPFDEETFRQIVEIIEEKRK